MPKQKLSSHRTASYFLMTRHFVRGHGQFMTWWTCPMDENILSSPCICYYYALCSHISSLVLTWLVNCIMQYPDMFWNAFFIKKRWCISACTLQQHLSLIYGKNVWKFCYFLCWFCVTWLKKSQKSTVFLPSLKRTYSSLTPIRTDS